MDRKRYHIYRLESPSEARGKIDKVKQGKAASEGLKRYWAELKANPEKYAEVMEAKKAKLRSKCNEGANI